jgi:hypothetical protein
MPVHRQKKDTTPHTSGSTPEQTAPALPEQRVFHQYVRELARGVIRVVLEGVMREDLDALIGVGWGESSPRTDGDVRGGYKHPTSVGEVAQTLMGMARSRQCHQSAQPRSGAAIHRLARTPTTRALAYPLSGRDPFQRASRREGRYDGHPHGLGRGSDR